ncbi:MAG: DEAD/DEAH box helicase [Thermoplasmata archaeon]
MSHQRPLEEYGEPEEAGRPARAPRRPDALPGIWGIRDGHVVHPLLREDLIRALPFQIDLARIGLGEDLLVVLPTGLGKTVIAALLAAERLRAAPGKVLFLAPTRPLVDQHSESFGRWFVRLARARFSGSLRAPSRHGTWEGAEVVFATPQIIVNDLAQGRYSLSEVSLLIVDEAHRAVGKYAYVAVAEAYRNARAEGRRVLALTASPGSQETRIEEVMGVLGIHRVEARHRSDEGVREYVQPVTVETVWVELPAALKRVRELLSVANRGEARKLQKMGYLRTKPIARLSVKDLVALRGEIFARPGPMVRRFGPLYHQMMLLHLHQAQERLETQGAEPFVQYLERVALKPKPGKADRALLKMPEVMAARQEADRFLSTGEGRSHPKLDSLARLVEEEMAVPRGRPPRILVFAQYRDTIQGIQEDLARRGHTVGRFVGQASRDREDRGMSQTEQHQVLEGFRKGRFPILVASSVAEEGIDVPDVDLVVFFEAVPSEIRAIQRRGRTGRSSLGRVVLLLTAETRDVGYQRAETLREESMTRVIRKLSRQGRQRASAAVGASGAPSEGHPSEAPRSERDDPVGSSLEPGVDHK